MGASNFSNGGKGKTAQEVFTRLVDDSRHEFGHSYSGEIGMKSSFKMVTVPEGMTVDDFIDQCFEDENHICQDKYGPAACVKVSEGHWIFFGYASS